MIFRGVEYSEAGEGVMRGLGRLWRATDDEDVKQALVDEAETFHAFHAEFPGLVVHESGLGTEGSGNAPVSSEATAEPASRPETLFEDVA